MLSLSVNNFNNKPYFTGTMKSTMCLDGLFHKNNSKFLRDTVPELPKIITQYFPKEAQTFCYGCSSGEDSYYLALLLLNSFPDRALKYLPVRSFDIAPDMIRQAQSGKIQIGPKEKRKFARTFQNIGFEKGFIENPTVKNDYSYNVSVWLRNQITFDVGNFLEDIKKPFNEPSIVFCRNMWHQFRPKTTVHIKDIADNLHRNLKRGGIVVLGELEYENVYINVPKALKQAGFMEVQKYIFIKPIPAPQKIHNHAIYN